MGKRCPVCFPEVESPFLAGNATAAEADADSYAATYLKDLYTTDHRVAPDSEAIHSSTADAHVTNPDAINGLIGPTQSSLP